jgi:hypothetical protein
MRDYRDQRLYQGDLLDKKIPVWVEYLGAIVMGAIFGAMFAYGI